MKKQNLRQLRQGAATMLTKEQMKGIKGGTGCKMGQCLVIQGPGLCGGDGIHTACSCIVAGIAYPTIQCAPN